MGYRNIGSLFAHPNQISSYINSVFKKLAKENHLRGLAFNTFCQKAAYYFGEINATHPFREGNGRTQRLFLDQLALNTNYELRWGNVDLNLYTTASIQSFNGDNSLLEIVFQKITRPLNKHQALIMSTPYQDLPAQNEVFDAHDVDEL